MGVTGGIAEVGVIGGIGCCLMEILRDSEGGGRGVVRLSVVVLKNAFVLVVLISNGAGM